MLKLEEQKPCIVCKTQAQYKCKDKNCPFGQGAYFCKSCAQLHRSKSTYGHSLSALKERVERL